MISEIEKQALYTKAVEQAKHEILASLAITDPWLFDETDGLYHLMRKIPNGKKTFSVMIKDGFVTEVIIHTNVAHKYTR